MESEEQATNQPAYSDRRGRVKLAIWENESPSGVRYVAEITRSWKDGEDYETTHRFDEQDLLGLPSWPMWLTIGSLGKSESSELLATQLTLVPHFWLAPCFSQISPT